MLYSVYYSVALHYQTCVSDWAHNFILCTSIDIIIIIDNVFGSYLNFFLSLVCSFSANINEELYSPELMGFLRHIIWKSIVKLLILVLVCKWYANKRCLWMLTSKQTQLYTFKNLKLCNAHNHKNITESGVKSTIIGKFLNYVKLT